MQLVYVIGSCFDASHCVNDGYGKLIFGSGTTLHVNSSEYAKSFIYTV